MNRQCHDFVHLCYVFEGKMASKICQKSYYLMHRCQKVAALGGSVEGENMV